MKNSEAKIASLEIITNTKYPEIPTLAIRYTDKGEEREFYLMPFRAYSFQVCRTMAGEGDCGSSQVIGLKNVLESRPEERKYGMGYHSNLSIEDTAVELLVGQAQMALAKFSQKDKVFIEMPLEIRDYPEYGIIFTWNTLLDHWVRSKVIPYLKSI